MYLDCTFAWWIRPSSSSHCKLFQSKSTSSSLSGRSRKDGLIQVLQIKRRNLTKITADYHCCDKDITGCMSLDWRVFSDYFVSIFALMPLFVVETSSPCSFLCSSVSNYIFAFFFLLFSCFCLWRCYSLLHLSFKGDLLSHVSETEDFFLDATLKHESLA